MWNLGELTRPAREMLCPCPSLQTMEKTTSMFHLLPRWYFSTHFPLRAKLWAHVKGRGCSAKAGSGLHQCTAHTAIKTAQVGTKAILPSMWYPLCHCQLLSSCAILQKAPTQNILYLNINSAISIHGKEVSATDSQRPPWFTCKACMPISLVFPMNSYYLPIYTQIHHQRGGSCANNGFLHCL